MLTDVQRGLETSLSRCVNGAVVQYLPPRLGLRVQFMLVGMAHISLLPEHQYTS